MDHKERTRLQALGGSSSPRQNAFVSYNLPYINMLYK